MGNQAKSISMQAADNIRLLAAAMVEKAKSGHPGGAMGGADFMHILYSEYMTFDPDDTTYPHRDRFFLDPGHMSAMLYGQLALFGNYSLEEISNLEVDSNTSISSFASLQEVNPKKVMLVTVKNRNNFFMSNVFS